MVERADQLDVPREQHPVAEHVAGHIADSDDRGLRALDVGAELAEMALDRLPRAPRRDPHLLVVVARRPARGKRVAEPEAIVLRDRVRDVGEGGRALVGCDDEVRVVLVVAHHVRRRYDLAAGDRVGHVEQPVHEGLVAGDDLLEQRGAVAARRRPLDDEAALGADGDDHRVLHRLRLHQAQHLGAEVLAAVRPTDPAARDLPAAQVHRLGPRRVDEHLEHRPRLGQIGDQVRVELERQVRLRVPVGVGLEVVRPQDGADDAQVAAQDPVLVEARDLVDRGLDLPVERVRLRVGVDEPRRVEAQTEELDEPARDQRMRGQGVLHVGLAEGAAGLAQVLRDRPEDRDLAGGQLRGEDEAVEAVVLGLAAPRARERVLERLAYTVGLELRALGVLEAEVVDPHGRAVARPDLVRSLVGDLDAHVLEQRQDVREQQRRAAAEQLEGEVVGRGERHVEAHAEVVGRIELLDPGDVEDGLAREEVLPVGAGERLAVALEQPAGALLAVVLGERVAEVVRPLARRGGQAGLDLGGVVGRDAVRIRVDDIVQAREHRLGDARRVVDADPVEGLAEDLVDPPPVLGVEALAREVDEAREEAAERVPPDEEADAPPLAEMEDAERDLEQLVLGDLEQLVARVRLDDLDQGLVVVAARDQLRALEDTLRLAAQHRDLPRARAVGGVRQEAEEAPLADDLARGVEALDPDVVEVRRPVDGRARVGLRQVEEGLLAGQPPHLGRQLREARRDRLLAALPQDAEPRAAHDPEHVLAVFARDRVLAVAEEGEVPVVEPGKELARLLELLLVDRRRRLVELGEDVADALAHRRPVLDGGAHVAEDAEQVAAELVQRRVVGLAVDLDVDHRLGAAVLCTDVEQPALVVAPHSHDRADDKVDRVPVARHLHRDRVDEERHVVDDRLDDGVRRVPAVVLHVRRVDVHLDLGGLPYAGEVPVRERGAGEVELVPVEQVVRRHVRVIRPHEPLELGRLGAVGLLAHARDRRLEQCRLRLVGARRHRGSSLLPLHAAV